MQSSLELKQQFSRNPWLQELAYLCLFGFLSALMGLVEFQIPGLGGTATDLREIPILISVVYIKNPVSTIGIILLSALSMHEDGAFISYFLMHLPSSLAAWFVFQKIKTYTLRNWQLGIIWCFVTLFYYSIIIPSYIISENVFVNNPLPFYDSVQTLLISTRFEIITTAMVSSLYIIQNNIRNQLREHKVNLEGMVKERTSALYTSNQQLLTLNEELTASHEEVRSLNDNLEKIVLSRTERINEQLKQLEKYAYMNSHEVRGPVARILGLIDLIQMEENRMILGELISKLSLASEELDAVIKKMNRLLEEDAVSKPPRSDS